MISGLRDVDRKHPGVGEGRGAACMLFQTKRCVIPSPSLFQTWIARCPQETDDKEFAVIVFGSREHKTKEISK